MSQDPKGFGAGDTNLYRYVGDVPDGGGRYDGLRRRVEAFSVSRIRFRVHAANSKHFKASRNSKSGDRNDRNHKSAWASWRRFHNYKTIKTN